MLEIEPLKASINATLGIPGSKYIANRLMILASLARGESQLLNVPVNEDIQISQKGMEGLGSVFSKVENGFKVQGVDGLPKPLVDEIYTAGSGTFARFILSAASLSNTPIRINGNAKMNTRPMKPLIEALTSLGVKVNHTSYLLPLTVKGPLKGGKVEIDASQSSQFVSSLLLAGVYTKEGLELIIKGEDVSASYIAMTIELMKRYQVEVETIKERHFFVPPNQHFIGQNITIEADPVSSSYFLAIAALSGGKIAIPSFNFEGIQGESRFAEVLQAMGCEYHFNKGMLTLQGPQGDLKAVEVDMGDMPDVVQTLAVLACFAKGTTKISNIAHLKHKESDRVRETAQELRKLQIEVEDTEDSLTIIGGSPKGALIDPHGDHRMAMSFAVAGIKIPGMQIADPECTGKSFPNYWEKLKELGVQIHD